MKKTFLITHADGTTCEIPIERYVRDLPINVAPNDRNLLKLTCELAREGYAIHTDTEKPRWIAPAFIKHIDIIFESPLKVS
jgi:hypothetical protein